jgi:hypothetical protein
MIDKYIEYFRNYRYDARIVDYRSGAQLFRPVCLALRRNRAFGLHVEKRETKRRLSH